MNFDDFFVVRGPRNHAYVSFVDAKMFCQKFTDGLVGGAVYWRGFDLDLVTAVRELRHAFAFASGMDFDVDFHMMPI